MSQEYTVVGEYEDPSEGSFVDAIKAMTPQHAADISFRDREKAVKIIAVFVGRHSDDYVPMNHFDSYNRARMDELDKEMETER